MPTFQYKAVTPTGETIRGEIDAGSAEDAARILQEAGNIPLQARATSEGGGLDLRAMLVRSGKPGAREVGQFTQQMATLLQAGLPLDRSLQVLIDLAENDRTRRMVEKVRDHVREGGTLSDGLEAQHGVFNRLYVNMVRAGELGGTLEETLARLADYLQRSKELKDSIGSALVYPIMLMVLAAGSLILLLTYVIPQFTPIFEDMGADLPTLTRVVLGVGSALQNYWWLMILIGAGLVWFFRAQFANPKTRLQWDKRILHMRWIGDLVAKMETAKLARTTGTLLVNGVPLLGALSIARNVMTNTVLQAVVGEAANEVKTGHSLARTLAKDDTFPRLALQMISVGEETGQLDQMLLRVADTFDREVRTTVDRLMSLFVPLMTLVLAVMIGLIVMSVLVAILGINELV